MTFTSPISLFFAVLLAIGIFVTAWLRRPALPRRSLILAACGIICLTLATGGASCLRGKEPRVAVMVDVSPSTRGASFRDIKWVRARTRDLLGSRPYDLYAFADASRRLREGEALVEATSNHTQLAPPPVDAIVLFSDGRFDIPPVTAPVTAVLDPALESPTDAAIVNLEERGTQLAAEVRNNGPERELIWVNKQRQSATAPTGSTVLTTRLVTTTETITARLAPGDAWPENDALAIRPSPPIASQRWWIGDSPPRGWMSIAPANLPLESSAWLGPAIVVLNNIPADAISPPQQDRLQQYVRDLGGALVITGGDHAFAAGHYPGSTLEAISPLASSPPEPVTHWVLLVDSSGSMSAPAGGSTRLHIASDALVSIVRELPKSDLVSIGSFARQLRWWSIARSAQDTSLMKLPPPDLEATGPTNLEAALKQIDSSQPSSPPINLLVLSDAETGFADITALSAELKDHQIRIHALSIGATQPDSPLRRLAEATGGSFVQEMDSSQWLARVRRMLRAVTPDQIVHEPNSIKFIEALHARLPRTTPTMNRAWLKQGASQLATASAGSDHLPAAARWAVGTGDVLAMAFAPNVDEISAIEPTIARRPRDPRFGVSWRAGQTLHVQVDARDARGYLNEQPLSLEIGAPPSARIPQTAPGRYEIDIPAPRSPVTVSILNDGKTLDRFAVAGRYPQEFDAVGNDINALRALTDHSGGQLIEPTQHTMLEFPDTRRATSLAAGLAVLGAIFLAAALVAWRIA